MDQSGRDEDNDVDLAVYRAELADSAGELQQLARRKPGRWLLPAAEQYVAAQAAAGTART